MIAWTRRFLNDSARLLRVSAVLTLVALVLMVWSMFDPSVWPLMIAMSAGQALGTLALGLFLFVVARDLRRGKRDGTDAP